jgi:ribonuclease HII
VDLPRFIIGVDEAGYGCIAGPLVAAAVAFSEDQPRPVVVYRGRTVPVKDSKKLSDEILPQMAQRVAADCCGYEIQRITPASIDKQGAEKAKFQALQSVARRLLERLRFRYNNTVAYRVIIDGHVYLGPGGFEYEALPQADARIWQVSAASVLAKNTQIEAIALLHEEFPNYGWDENHGYGTPKHLAALRRFGVTPHHRRSYAPVAATLECRRKETAGGWGWG